MTPDILQRALVYLRRVVAPTPHPRMDEVSSARDAVVREAGRLEREIDRNNFSIMIKGMRGERSRSGAGGKKS